MHVELDSQTEELIKERVDSGRFNNASEVVREALRRMDEEDRYEALRAAVADGYEEAERGELVFYTPELFEEIKAQAREDARMGPKVDPLVLP